MSAARPGRRPVWAWAPARSGSECVRALCLHWGGCRCPPLPYARRSSLPAQVAAGAQNNLPPAFAAACDGACFAGVDGKYNDGARKALNYLLYGCSGYDVAQSSKSDADLSDVSGLHWRNAFAGVIRARV